MVDLADEYRHTPGNEENWSESWYFSANPGASWSISIELKLWPHSKTAQWSTFLHRTDERVLVVLDDSLALPRGASFEVRGSGLWADLTCHEPLKRWQVNFEGIALAIETPGDAYGDPVPIEFEFEFESSGSVDEIEGGGGYTVYSVVDGEVTIGSAGNVLSLDEPVLGFWLHAWGAD